MSKVDVMLPQDRLPCVTTQKSPKPSVAELVRREPSADGFLSENHKQLDKSNFGCSKLDSDNAFDVEVDRHLQVRKKKHRRGKRRKWKPYSRLTWAERRKLDERIARRATRTRAQMSGLGLPLAPYNTTQFLMEDHNLQEPVYEHFPPNGHRHRENSNSMESSEDYYSSPEDEEDFLHRQFIETYEDINIERLNSMSKTELVQELMCMEDKLETLEKSLHDERLHRDSTENEARVSDQDLEAQLEKIRVYRQEIQKLAEENERLRRENDQLRNRLPMSVRETTYLRVLELSPSHTHS